MARMKLSFLRKSFCSVARFVTFVRKRQLAAAQTDIFKRIALQYTLVRAPTNQILMLRHKK